jgi:hypothetical protein
MLAFANEHRCAIILCGPGRCRTNDSNARTARLLGKTERSEGVSWAECCSRKHEDASFDLVGSASRKSEARGRPPRSIMYVMLSADAQQRAYHHDRFVRILHLSHLPYFSLNKNVIGTSADPQSRSEETMHHDRPVN